MEFDDLSDTINKMLKDRYEDHKKNCKACTERDENIIKLDADDFSFEKESNGSKTMLHIKYKHIYLFCIPLNFDESVAKHADIPCGIGFQVNDEGELKTI